MTQPLTLDDLLAMTHKQVADVFFKGHPIAPGSLDGLQYRGIDLSLPPIMNKILWKTFRKTFYRDPKSGVLRGWNVRMVQDGWDSPGTPLQKKGKPFTFGHYHLLPAQGKKFPKNWQGQDYLDYGVAGNPVYDPAYFGYCPIVAVNAGSSELLLGWEIFRVAGVNLPLPDFWALRREGPIDYVAPVPNEA